MLGVEFEGSTHESEQLLIADVRLDGLDRDSWHIWPDADGRSPRLGLCPLPGTDDSQLTLFLVRPDKQLRGDSTPLVVMSESLVRPA